MILAALVVAAGCSSSGNTSTSDPARAVSSAAVAATETTESAAPVLLDATPAGDTVEVPAVLDGETVLGASVDGVDFRLVLPTGAVRSDVMFSVTPAHTSAGDPAMLVEPAGWSLFVPGELTASDDRPLLAWGPTGIARRLPDRDGGDDATVVVALGGVALAHDDEEASAADEGPDDDPVDAWTREQERKADEDGAPRLDPLINNRFVGPITDQMQCNAGDKSEAKRALEAVRAGIALEVGPKVPPDCFKVWVKIVIQWDNEGQLLGNGNGHEAMSGSGYLEPTGDAHVGQIVLATESSGRPEDVEGCEVLARPGDDFFEVTMRWPGTGTAEMTLRQTQMAVWRLSCLDGVPVEFPMMIASIIDGYQSEVPFVINTAVTEGTVRLFSKLDQFQRSGMVDKDGVMRGTFENVVYRFSFSAEVVYTLAES